ncbi:hypothetical protein [Aeromonas jandaei]|uniref:hypothetical protein n=1 Tax=Aeromonas jandaei TaxID=650 RepID=UPI003EC83CC5
MLKVEVIMNRNADMSLPYYLQVARWLYEEQRFLSARETATILGRAAWLMEREFDKIRRKPNIFIIDERQVRISGGKQSLIRVKYIHPYFIDELQQLHRQHTDAEHFDRPLTWHDLLCRQWRELVHIKREFL